MGLNKEMRPRLLGRAWHDCGIKPDDFAASVHACLCGLTLKNHVSGIHFDYFYVDEGVCEVMFVFISRE